KQGHVGQRLAHRGMHDVGPQSVPGFVGGQRQRLLSWGLVFLAGDLLPDFPVDAVRVAPPRWVQIDDEEVDALLQQFGRLLDERPQRVAGGLVAGRNNLDYRHDTVAADVTDGDDLLFAAVERHVRLGDGL